MPFRRISHNNRRKTRLKGTQKTIRTDAEAVKIRNSGRWQKLRALVLIEEPLCRDPYGEHMLADRLEISVEVHHIVPLCEDISKAYDRSNCAGLCIACHRRVDADNRAGKPTAHLFDGISASRVEVLKIEQNRGAG